MDELLYLVYFDRETPRAFDDTTLDFGQVTNKAEFERLRALRPDCSIETERHTTFENGGAATTFYTLCNVHEPFEQGEVALRFPDHHDI